MNQGDTYMGVLLCTIRCLKARLRRLEVGISTPTQHDLVYVDMQQQLQLLRSYLADVSPEIRHGNYEPCTVICLL